MPTFIGIDTALQNTGVAVLDQSGHPLEVFKPIDPNSSSAWHSMERVLKIRDSIRATVEKYSNKTGDNKVFVAMEDFIMSKFSTAYQTAELLGILKAFCHDSGIGYCLVHPLKTKKYVRKAKDVSKTEIIEFWENRFSTEFPSFIPRWSELPGSARSDCADALCIGDIGRLVWLESQVSDFLRPGKTLPPHHSEIIWVADTGILTKPGLFWKGR